MIEDADKTIQNYLGWSNSHQELPLPGKNLCNGERHSQHYRYKDCQKYKQCQAQLSSSFSMWQLAYEKLKRFHMSTHLHATGSAVSQIRCRCVLPDCS